MINGLIFQEGITISNMYPPDRNKICGAKPIELQGEIDECTIIVGDFSTFIFSDIRKNKGAEVSLSEMGRFSRQKIGKDILELNSTINPLGYN